MMNNELNTKLQEIEARLIETEHELSSLDTEAKAYHEHYTQRRNSVVTQVLKLHGAIEVLKEMSNDKQSENKESE